MKKEIEKKDKKIDGKKDYKEVGLIAGLEIHQQLDTKKLFCECPSLLRNDAPLFKIKRKLNPVIGESGKIDTAASFEAEKNKEFIYEVYDTNCLVELDEEPPHKINQEALEIALQIAVLLNCKIFPVTQIMRKTVIDGSNTSGFQRTVLIAHDGFLETSFGKVSVDYLFLEEDAARPSGKIEVDEPGFENSKTYKLDRLGFPLVEIATGPHMHTPEQIKEAALKIGEILRACKVKRGIGTIRQDVNISIKGSERVEIKGFQDPRMMIVTIDKEIERQKECVKEKKCKKEVRRANPDGSSTFLRPMPGESRMYPETDCELLIIGRELINKVKENLPKLRSEMQGYLQELGMNDELIRLVLDENKIEDFKVLKEKYDNLNLIAKMLTLFPKEISVKQNLQLEKVYNILNADVLERILKEIEKGNLQEQDIRLVMEKLAKNESFEEAVKKEKINLEEEIKLIMKEKPNLSINAYMGLIMAKFRGKVSGGEIMSELKKFVK